MRSLEIALVAAVVAALLLQLGSARLQPGAVAATALAAALVAALIATDAIRWQLAPALIGAAGAAAGLALARIGMPQGAFLAIVGGLGTTLGTVALAAALPIVRLPPPTGALPVGTVSRYLVDPARPDPGGLERGRELMVQLWYPAAAGGRAAPYRERAVTTWWNRRYALSPTHASSGVPLAAAPGRLPLVVLTPSWWGQRTDNTALAEELASHGFVVAAIDHPYGSIVTALPGGRLVRTRLISPDGVSSEAAYRAFEEASVAETRLRAADVRFVLDTAAAWNASDPDGLFTGRLDLARSAVLGYSLGGSVAFFSCETDARLRACVSLDGLIADRPERPLTGAPLFLLLGAQSPPPPEGIAADTPAARDARYAEAQRPLQQLLLGEHGGWLVDLPRFTHNDFSDTPFYSPLAMLTHRGAEPPERSAALLRRLIRAFLERALAGPVGTPPEDIPGAARSASFAQRTGG